MLPTACSRLHGVHAVCHPAELHAPMPGSSSQQCLSRFSASVDTQAFSAWIHVCAIRLFVESILRYGLPPCFLATLMKPVPKTVTKLRKALASTFASTGARNVLKRCTKYQFCPQDGPELCKACRHDVSGCAATVLLPSMSLWLLPISY